MRGFSGVLKKEVKIYLDTSVYNRPFDDQSQPRIWLETMAFFIILQLIETEKAELIISSVIEFENDKNPFAERRSWVNSCLHLFKENIMLNAAIRKRGKEMERQRIKPVDALHLACAESGKAEYFMTCDDKIVKHYQSQAVTALNPVEFIVKFTEEK